jgi:hypothetical protein
MRTFAALVSFLTFFFFSFSVQAQKLTPSQKTQVDNLYKNKQVVYFEAMVTSQQEAMNLKQIVSIDGAKGTKVRAHATKDQFTKFIVLNYKYTVLPSPGGAKKPAAKTTTASKKKTSTKKKSTTTSTKK